MSGVDNRHKISWLLMMDADISAYFFRQLCDTLDVVPYANVDIHVTIDGRAGAHVAVGRDTFERVTSDNFIMPATLIYNNSHLRHKSVIFRQRGKIYFYEPYGTYSKHIDERDYPYGATVVKALQQKFGEPVSMVTDSNPQTILLQANNEHAGEISMRLAKVAQRYQFAKELAARSEKNIDKNFDVVIAIDICLAGKPEALPELFALFASGVTKNCVTLCICEMYARYAKKMTLLQIFSGRAIANEALYNYMYDEVMEAMDRSGYIKKWLNTAKISS